MGTAIEALKSAVSGISQVALVGYSFEAYLASLAVPSLNPVSVACFANSG
jgi:hypothetical protein